MNDISMTPSFRGAWRDINQFDLGRVSDLILTGRTPNEAKPDEWLYEWLKEDIDKPMIILDFGCGVGRNIFDFSQNFPNWKFYGYDNPHMANKANEYSKLRFGKRVCDYSNLELMSDWDLLKTIKFDCIYATIVFQHIHEKDLNLYLQDIYIICSKQTKRNYETIIEKLKEKLKEDGILIKNFYYINETLYAQDIDQTRFKKIRLLIQHLVGYKSQGDKFINEEITRYDQISYYNNDLSYAYTAQPNQFDITQQYTDHFGRIPSTGDKVLVKFIKFNKITGQFLPQQESFLTVL